MGIESGPNCKGLLTLHNRHLPFLLPEVVSKCSVPQVNVVTEPVCVPKVPVGPLTLSGPKAPPAGTQTMKKTTYKQTGKG